MVLIGLTTSIFVMHIQIKLAVLDAYSKHAPSDELHRRMHRCDASSYLIWTGSLWTFAFLGLADEIFLKEAARQNLTLVTYDRRTIPPLLKRWAESSQDRGGVIFVDEKTIPPYDFGSLIHSLRTLYQESARWDWTNRVCFLKR